MTTAQKTYSMRKSQHILKDAIKRYRKLSKRLSHDLAAQMEEKIEMLHLAIHEGNVTQASTTAHALETFLKSFGKKTLLDHTFEMILALIVAITIAACVRQMWFELYEIPTGSMRPTFREQDRVLVVKNTFGINTPFQTSHLLFDPERVERGQIIVFSGDNLDMPDVDMLYFGFFPGKKRYVKRCMGKPGDTLYFYGGKIYGIDRNGNAISEFQSGELASLEHIPFVSFDGKTSNGQNKTIGVRKTFIRYMNIPVAEVIQTERSPFSKMLYTAPNGSKPSHFSDLFGVGNFAQARLLYPQELPEEAVRLGYTNGYAQLYLELKHHPSLLTRDTTNMKNPREAALLPAFYTWIPLNPAEIQSLGAALTTSRFVVKNSIAYRYSQDMTSQQRKGVFLNKIIPDGTYEFFSGTAHEIGFGGLSHTLAHDHPIYPNSIEDVKILFNTGIELTDLTNPTTSKGFFIFPSRYAYFRDGDLYLMNHRLLEKDSETLKLFFDHEQTRKQTTTEYTPFIDAGAPIKNGKIDIDTIMRYGVTIPEGHYFALGDNHPMSLDSRFFGFVPEDNLQGTPFALFWPVGARAGILPQPQVSFFRIENLYVWTAALLGIITTYVYFYRSTSRKKYLTMKQKRETKQQ